MISHSPQFPMYAQDFLAGTMYLTFEEKGMYITMLCKQWTDKKIPKKRLGFLIGKEWNELSEELQNKFIDLGEYVQNERLEAERDKRERFKDKQRENGKKGGRPSRFEKPKRNPNESQKKPLDNDIDKEKEKDNDSKRVESMREGSLSKLAKDELPFLDDFSQAWQEWLNYKFTQFDFNYKSKSSELIAVNKLANLSDGNSLAAKKIIEQSIANGWKGLFREDQKKPTGQSLMKSIEQEYLNSQT